MRIIVITGYWPTQANPTSGIFVEQQVRALAALGLDITVIAPQGSDQFRESRPYHRKEAFQVLSPTYLSVPQRVSIGSVALRLNTRACAVAIGKAMAHLRSIGAADIIHVNGLRYIGLALTRKPMVEAPIVLTLHGVDPVLRAQQGLPWLRKMLSRTWGAVSKTILVGRPLAAYARDLRVPAEKCIVIPNGHECEGPPARADQRPIGETRVMLSVSNLVALKGIDLNLRALAKVASRRPDLPWRYRIVGDGVERHRLQSLSQTLGIADRVVFLGRLPRADTMQEMRDCDIFSLPSWGDAFGIVYLEAMAQMRPVVGCVSSGAAESVRASEGILVPPNDVPSLAEGLERLLSDPDLCRRLGTAGAVRAAAFTWETNASRHVELYRSVLENLTPRSGGGGHG